MLLRNGLRTGGVVLLTRYSEQWPVATLYAAFALLLNLDIACNIFGWWILSRKGHSLYQKAAKGSDGR